MYNYRTALREQEVAHERAAYELLLTAFGGLNLAACEGVYEITVRSVTQTVTVQVPFRLGNAVATDLSSELEDRVVRAENRLNLTVENAGLECRIDRESKEQRDTQHHANIQQAQAAYAAQAQQLVKQVTAPAPQQPGPGRPRKKVAAPTPELVGELATGAAGVPMNGSTAHAVARATNAPQA
jgi:hypothetical protein